MGIIQLPDPFFNIMKALGQGGQNFLENKRLVDDRQRAEEDRQRQQKMQDLQTFLQLMPYMQGTTATGADGEMTAVPFAPPAHVSGVVKDLTGQANPLFSITPDMLTKQAAAKVAGSTVGDQIALTKNATKSSGLTVRGQEQTVAKGDYDLETSPIKDKQTYIAKEAPNYATAVVSEMLPATDKNRQTLIDSAYKNFVSTAPETPYKKSVRRDDFASAVDTLIAQEKQLDMERSRVRAYAAQVSQSGTPDYMRAASEMRMNIKNRLDQLKADEKLFPMIKMIESGVDYTPPPELAASYKEYKRLLSASNALMSVNADIMVNRGVPSKKGMEMLAQVMDAASGLSEDPGAGGGTAGGNAILEQFARMLRGKPSVDVEARIETAKRQGLLSPEEETKVRALLRGGKK